MSVTVEYSLASSANSLMVKCEGSRLHISLTNITNNPVTRSQRIGAAQHFLEAFLAKRALSFL